MGTVIFIGSKTSARQILHRLPVVNTWPLLNFRRSKEPRDTAVGMEAVYGSLSQTR